MQRQVKINRRTGTLEFLHHPGFDVGKTTRSRFSEIVPVKPWLRVPFRILRLLFGDTGRMSAWTRIWKCRWRLEILQGKHRGAWFESNSRQWLLDREKEIWFSGINEII